MAFLHPSSEEDDEDHEGKEQQECPICMDDFWYYYFTHPCSCPLSWPGAGGLVSVVSSSSAAAFTVNPVWEATTTCACSDLTLIETPLGGMLTSPFPLKACQWWQSSGSEVPQPHMRRSRTSVPVPLILAPSALMHDYAIQRWSRRTSRVFSLTSSSRGINSSTFWPLFATTPLCAGVQSVSPFRGMIGRG